MQPGDLKQRLYDQLALDYCCTPAEAADRKNQFHVYVPLEGRRRFEEKPVTFLKVVSFRNKLMFTVIGARNFSPEITVHLIGTKVPCFDKVPPP